MFISKLKTLPFAQPPADSTARNIRYLYLEILFAAIQGAIISYNSLLAVRLGGTTALVGVLTAAPALVAAVLSIPSARFLERKTDRRSWLFRSLLFMRLGYLMVVVLPLLAPQNTALWLVVWLIILNLPNALFTNGFNALLAELVPERRRAFVFSRRTIIWSLTVVAVVAAAGTWLDRVVFPLNYQLLYLVGVITVMGSQYYLNRLQLPAMPHAAIVPKADQKVQTAQAFATSMRAMRPMLTNTLIYQVGLQISAPLFIIYYANTLHADDGLISINTAAGTLGVVFGLILWEAVLRKRTFGWVLRVATLGTWIFPFTIAFSHNFLLIITANFVVNLLHPAVDLSTLNVILGECAPEERNMRMSYYTTIVNVSAFIGPLAAVPLSSWIGIPGVMLVAAAFRIGGGVLFSLNRVDRDTQS